MQRSYKDILRVKLAELFMEHRVEMGNECFEELAALINDECRRSFKNGAAVGRKANSAPRAKSALRESALQAGRLKPIVQASA